MTQPAETFNPYPGLRPFEADESHLFFGREGQSDELLVRLRRNRFLAVVGTSGSGKSSLVRAGLLPALHGGFMAGVGPTWSIALIRPGDHPVGRLALALSNLQGGAGAEAENRPDASPDALAIEATLRRSGLGLIDAVRQARMPEDQSLLIVVDQFEELFRFRHAKEEAAAEDATAFVKLLLEAATQTAVPIFIVLTMRSDYLGHCSRFRGLPEKINDAQYLIPRMTRDERRHAIVGPALVAGGCISMPLINRLLNDAGDRPEVLPILQHALMRTWDYWRRHAAPGEEIDLEHYDNEEVGTMTNALSRHAEEAHRDLADERSQALAAILFKRLTEKAPERGLEIGDSRRPTAFSEICAVAEVPREEEARLIAVIEIFRRAGRSFLLPAPPRPLTAHTILDISHESLISGWERLKSWAKDEQQSAQVYLRLSDAARRHRLREAALWQDPDLRIAQQERANNGWNEAWASRYDENFKQAEDFLQESEEQQQDEERRARGRQRLQWAAIGLPVVLLGVVILGGIVWRGLKQNVAQRYFTAAVHARESGEELRAVHLFGLVGSGRGTRMAMALNGPLRATVEASFLNGEHLLQAFLVRELPAPSKIVSASLISRDKSRFGRWSQGGSLTLWDPQTGEEIGTAAGIQGAVAGNRRIVAWTDHALEVLDPPGKPTSFEVVFHDGGSIGGTALSPDDSLVVTWSKSPIAFQRMKTSVLVHTVDGKVLCSFDHVGSGISGAGFNSKGNRLLVWGYDGNVELQDVDVGHGTCALVPGITRKTELLPNAPALDDRGESILVCEAGSWTCWLEDIAKQPGPPVEIDGSNAQFTGNGRILSWGFDPSTADGAALWDRRGNRVRLFGHDGIAGVSVSPDGRRLLTWSSDRTARLWNVESGSPTELPQRGILGAEFQDLRRVLAWSDDNCAHLWDAEKAASVSSPMCVSEHLVGAVLAPSRRVLTWSQGQARLWQLPDRPQENGKPAKGPKVDTLVAAGGNVVGFSKSEAWIWLQGSESPRQLVHPEDLEIPDRKQGPDEVVRAVLSQDGTQLLIWTHERAPRSWNLDRHLEEQRHGALEEAIAGAVYSPDGSRILTWSRTGGQLWNSRDRTRWNSRDRTRLKTFDVPAPGPGRQVTGGLFSSRGDVALWSSDGLLWIWNDHGGQSREIRAGRPAGGATFSRDGRSILAWSGDQDTYYGTGASGSASPPALKLFRVDDPRAQDAFTLHDVVVQGGLFSPDDRSIVTWGGSTATLWSARGRRLFSLPHDRANVLGARFSSDGSLLATWSDTDNGARLWNVRDGKLVVRLRHDAQVQEAVFNKDDRLLLTRDVDGHLRVWNTSEGSPALAPMQYGPGLAAAGFNPDPPSVLAWGLAGPRSWDIGADDDLDPGLFRLLVEVATGTEIDQSDNVRPLDAASWMQRRREYIKKAGEHLVHCKHREANLFLKQRGWWGLDVRR